MCIFSDQDFATAHPKILNMQCDQPRTKEAFAKDSLVFSVVKVCAYSFLRLGVEMHRVIQCAGEKEDEQDISE